MADQTRLFAHLAQADIRALVQGYSGLLLRIADGRPLSAPLGMAPGFGGLVGVTPLWADQFSVSAYDEAAGSPTYGQPLSYALNGHIGGAQPGEAHIHASRILLVSADGTLGAPSALAAGYNALLTWQKIMGAGGRGFGAMPAIPWFLAWIRIRISPPWPMPSGPRMSAAWLIRLRI